MPPPLPPPRGCGREGVRFTVERVLTILDRENYPKASSSADSSGVPQTRQRTAEQSPHTSGSCTGRAQTGHQRSADGEVPEGVDGMGDAELVIQIERSTFCADDRTRLPRKALEEERNG